MAGDSPLQQPSLKSDLIVAHVIKGEGDLPVVRLSMGVLHAICVDTTSKHPLPLPRSTPPTKKGEQQQAAGGGSSSRQQQLAAANSIQLLKHHEEHKGLSCLRTSSPDTEPGNLYQNQNNCYMILSATSSASSRLMAPVLLYLLPVSLLHLCLHRLHA